MEGIRLLLPRRNSRSGPRPSHYRGFIIEKRHEKNSTRHAGKIQGKSVVDGVESI
jgi:hypothetical protein